jgi:hypothetical protein
MVHGVAMEGSSVVLAFGRPAVAERRFVAANDNGPKDPVKTVTVRKLLEQSGVAIKIKVPVTEFIGVAVATSISEEGMLTSSIELVHADSELNYKVFEEEGNHNVVAEWQNWGKKLRLPLFIKAGDGAYLPYSQQVDGVMLGTPRRAASWRPKPPGGRVSSTAASPVRTSRSKFLASKASRKGSTGGAVGPFALGNLLAYCQHYHTQSARSARVRAMPT